METPTPPPSAESPLHLHSQHNLPPVAVDDHINTFLQNGGHAAVEEEEEEEQQQLLSSSIQNVTPNNVSYYPDTGTNQDSEVSPSSLSSSMTRSIPVTRTVAIIKNHALHHRFDIEPRIQEASFEIVKERQMEFDVETDPDTLYELFGEDADSLGEGPVWVYVLERKRAVEVWSTLMGHRDPEVARIEAPNSLRALYGVSLDQNALMGSPDTQTAEIQISALFASSPPFRTAELAASPESDHYGSTRSLSSSIHDSLRTSTSEAGGYDAASSVAGASTITGSNKSNGKLLFKARPVPATNIEPDIAPRMTRAAALRITGVVVDNSRSPPSKPRLPLNKKRHAQTFANVPGHKRAETIQVASTAPPMIAPRMTKAAALRIAKESSGGGGSGGVGIMPMTPPSSKIIRRAVTESPAASTEKVRATFEGVPGHKRRETISVASVKPPTMAPRLNKSAALRQLQKEGGPPTSFRGTPPTSPPNNSAAPSRRQSVIISTTRPTPSRRASSALDFRSSTTTSTPKIDSGIRDGNSNGDGDGDTSNIPGTSSSSRPASAASKLRPRPSSVIGPPTIAPRTNKSAALRAAKMEAEAQAAKKKAQRASKPPPSSFKAVAT